MFSLPALVQRGAVTALVAAAAVSCLSRPALVPQLFTIEPPPERAAAPAGRAWNQELAEMLLELERDLDAALSRRRPPGPFPPPGQ